MERNNELKPCPFCGGKVMIATCGDEDELWFFVTRGIGKTQNCTCRVFMESERFPAENQDATITTNIRNKLIDAWNRRANDDTICGAWLSCWNHLKNRRAKNEP